jgi:hypothetical protein
MFKMLGGAFLCRPPKQNEIHLHNALVGPGTRPEYCLGRGRQLRRCPLVMTSLRAAKFDSWHAARSGVSANGARILRFKTAILALIRSCSRPFSRSAARFAAVFLVRQNRKSQFWGYLPQNELFRRHCLP